MRIIIVRSHRDARDSFPTERPSRRSTQSQSNRRIPTQPNPSNLPSLLIRSTSRRRHPETHPPPPLSLRELGSPARCASQGLVRGHCPVAGTAVIRTWASTRTMTTHSRPWRIPITGSLLETKDLDLPPRAHRPAMLKYWAILYEPILDFRNS
jgi:hypothetical protein